MILVDRIEEQIVILEMKDEGQSVRHMTIAVSDLGITVAEGDVLVQTAAGWQVDVIATQCRKQRMFHRFRRMIQNEA